MTNDNTTYRKKANAVLFATVMVVSMLAAGFVAAPAAATVDDVGSASGDSIAINQGSTVEQVTISGIDSSTGATGTITIPYSSLSASVTATSAAVDSDGFSGSATASVSGGDVVITTPNEGATDVSVTVDVTFDSSSETGPAAPASESISVTGDSGSAPLTVSYTGTTEYIQDNGNQAGVVFQGQDVYLIGSDIAGQDGATVNLREVDSFDSGSVDGSSQVEQLTVDTAGDVFSTLPSGVGSSDEVVEIDTDDLGSGDYFVRGAGSLAAQPPRDDTFEVTVQDLTAEFDDDSVTDEGSNAETDFDISSDRGSYSLNVSADGDLDEEELFNIFTGDGTTFSGASPTGVTAAGVASGSVSSSNTFGPFNAAIYAPSEEDADQKIVLVGITDTEDTVDFNGIDEDDYEFEYNVTDTEASDVGSITVSELDRTADFSQSSYSQTAGDVVEMTVELDDTDNTWVQIGSEDAGFVDILYLEDDDDDDEVTFEVNTRTAGTNVPAAVVYNSEDDIVQSEMYNTIDSSNEADFFDEDDNPLGVPGAASDDFEAYLDAIGLIDVSDGDTRFDQLTRPLQPTTYDVAANGNNDFIVNDDDDSELDDEIGLATLDLTQPGVENVQTWTAPSNPADETSNASEILDSVTQSSEIAIDDQLVVQVEASGIYGHMVALDSDNFDALDDGFDASTLDTLANNNALEGEGVNLEIEADDATGNQDPTSLDLSAGQDIVSVIVDEESSQMFIVVDTSEDSAFSQELGDDTDFTAELEYEADEDNQFNFDDPGSTSPPPATPALGGANGATDTAAFPYFAAGGDNTESASADFSLADRDATFDNTNADGDVEIAVSEEATVSGTTNVAPGSDVSVRVQSTSGVSPSFVETTDVEVAEDGSFSGEFDFSSQNANDSATVSFRVEGSSVADSDAVLVEEVDTAPAFTVSDLDPQDVTATVGDALTVSATVENTGSSEATQTVEFRVGGDAVADQEVTLEGGESTTVEFADIDTSGLDAGEYEHGVFTDDDSQTATLTLEAADDGEDGEDGEDGTDGEDGEDGEDGTDGEDGEDGEDGTDGEDGGDGGTDDSTPGFGALVALVALIAAALLATRRTE